MKQSPRWINALLWLVYLSLLAVLLPHTAWAFNRFEPDGLAGQATGWAAAFAFEAAIAVLTHKLAKHIEAVKRGKRRFVRRYLNAYSVGLIVAMLVSALANLAHAVQFGRELAIFGQWGVPFGVYAVAFGGILPLVSLLFARVLSNVVDTETEENTELIAAKAAIKEVRRELDAANKRAMLAEERFAAIGDFARLYAPEKRERILFVNREWPKLPRRSVAIMTDSSPGYVTEVLEDNTERG